jgi:sulfonate transport system substrate-binding protein
LTLSSHLDCRSAETAGLRLTDVEAVSLSGADAFTAFAQGSIDGWVHWQPAAALALARLGDRARRLQDVKTYDYAFYVARREVAEKYPQTFAKFVKIIRDTQAYISGRPAEAVAHRRAASRRTQWSRASMRS